VVEHEDRIICSGCLAKITASAEMPARTWSFRPLLRFAAAFSGIIVAWFIYFGVGRTLLAIPDESHAETLWKRTIEHLIDNE
jgi:hypothetical protein